MPSTPSYAFIKSISALTSIHFCWNFCNFTMNLFVSSRRYDIKPVSVVSINVKSINTQKRTQKGKKAPVKKKRSRVYVKKQRSYPKKQCKVSQDDRWEKRYDELMKFRHTKGHCLVPNYYPPNPPLAHWVSRQRYHYSLFQQGRRSNMTRERIHLLEQVGFIWDSHEAVWQQRIRDLIQFRVKHGHGAVPSKLPDNPRFATWAKCQRYQYKLFLEGSPSNLTQERVLELERFGFEWSLRSTNEKTQSVKNADSFYPVSSAIFDDESETDDARPISPIFSCDYVSPRSVVTDLECFSDQKPQPGKDDDSFYTVSSGIFDDESETDDARPISPIFSCDYVSPRSVVTDLECFSDLSDEE